MVQEGLKMGQRTQRSQGPFLVPSQGQEKNLSIAKKRKINEWIAFFNFVGFSAYKTKRIKVKKGEKHRKCRKKIKNEKNFSP